MKFEPKQPPRRFTVGNSVKFQIMDCGTLDLAADEQVTFVTDSGAEYDVTRKSWGFYATPSLDARLADFGLRALLIRNMTTGRYFIFLVEHGREDEMDAYVKQEGLEVVAWLDSRQALDELRQSLHGHQK